MRLKDPITVTEAASELGVSTRRVRALFPRLITQKLGAQTFIERASLDNVRDRQPGRPKKDEAE